MDMLFTTHYVISGLLATALLFTSPSFENPIDSTDTTLEERSESYVACAEIPRSVKVCCYVERIDYDTFRTRMTIENGENHGSAKCRFYSRVTWWDSPLCWHRPGPPNIVSCGWFTVNRSIDGFQAQACDVELSTCKWSRKITF